MTYMTTPTPVRNRQKGVLQPPSLLNETGASFSSTAMRMPTPVSHRQQGSLQPPSLLKELGVFFSSTAEAMMIDCILSCVCGFCLKDDWFVCLFGRLDDGENGERERRLYTPRSELSGAVNNGIIRGGLRGT